MIGTARSLAALAASLITVTAMAGLDLAHATTPAAAHGGASRVGASPDFNGDGFDDLPIGTPSDFHLGGSVTVLYGSAAGVTADGAQLWNLDTPGIEGEGRWDDGFGAGVAGGDFDGDGYDDLIVGTTEKYVNVIRGSAEGLTVDGNYQLALGKDGMPPPVYDDSLGGELVVADFDVDGFDDVAAASPGRRRTVGGVPVGGVVIIPGSSSGLDPGQSFLLSLEVLGEQPNRMDGFGAALAAGDANGDGYPELAVGIPMHETRGGVKRNEGAAIVVRGSADGLQTAGAQLWRQATPGVPDRGREREEFGSAVDLVDLDADGFDELVVGAPYDLVRHTWECGSFTVLPGGPGGITAAGSKRWHRDTPGVAGRCMDSTYDYGYANSIASGDLDADGAAELLVGASYAMVPNGAGGEVETAGAASVLSSGPSGLVAAESQWWHQGRPGVPDTPEHQDLFGQFTAIGDFDGDGFGDAAITAYHENREPILHAGQVHVLYGTTSLLTADRTQVWHPDVPGVPGESDAHGGFGALVED